MKMEKRYYVGSGSMVSDLPRTYGSPPCLFDSLDAATERAAHMVGTDGVTRPVVEIRRIVRKSPPPVVVETVDGRDDDSSGS